MRATVAVCLFGVCTAILAVAEPQLGLAQQKKDDKKKADPKTFIPDAATLKTITDKTEELRTAIKTLKQKNLPDDVLIDVEIYLKAAENIVRFEEWLAAASVKWTLTTLDQGLARAKLAQGGKPVWRDAPGKWVVRAYRSSVDNSIQPYAVLLPHDFDNNAKKKHRLDVVLHGRDGSLTEAKFIASHGGTAPKDLGYIQLEVYGRGNNAYRWAGESDVFEAMTNFRRENRDLIDPHRIVLRGFSMGGAGTWHYGLRHPGEFCVIGPGAGFTTTHGYIANLPKELPEHQEKCLRIYDAYLYAENAFNVPVVAYSGEKDAQKKAADNIENALKSFKEPHHFKYLIAPGLEHQMPKEWQDKAEAEYRKYADKGSDPKRPRIRFVTYTPGVCDWLEVTALEKQNERTVVDATRKEGSFTITTTNVRMLRVTPYDANPKQTVTIDGQKLEFPEVGTLVLERVNGKWSEAKNPQPLTLRKKLGVTGPIDHAFVSRFDVVKPSQVGWYTATDDYTKTAFAKFGGLWDRYFRSALPTHATPKLHRDLPTNLVLFGDPQSNPMIAEILPKLPITWTKEKLIVNGIEYDAKTHIPVLIYPNPLQPSRYVVLNSGHTFTEADLKGTNALLYPRLGDWAVIKPTPTAKDPGAHDVVAAGLFDENWQFSKKK